MSQGDAQSAGEPRADQTVEVVLGRWPAAIGVFLRSRMACVGCAMARFDTLEQAARSYGLPVDALVGALREAIGEEESDEDYGCPSG